MRFFICICCAVIVGCASPPQKLSMPKGKYEWRNDELYDQHVGDQQLEKNFQHDKNTCKIQSLQVGIPSPSCSTVAAPDCSKFPPGLAQGACQSTSAYQQCNYSSVNAAQHAQDEIFDSCMGLNGWRKVWTPETTVLTTTSSMTERARDTMCVDIGNIAKAETSIRDAGLDQSSLEQENRRKLDASEISQNTYDATTIIVPWIYRNAKATPEHAQEIFFDTCMSNTAKMVVKPN